VVEHHRGTGVGQQVGVGDADGVAEAILEAVLGRRTGADEAAIGQARQGGGVGRGVDRDGGFLQHAAIDDGGWGGLAGGQVAAPDGDVGWLAGRNDARVDGVDPRGGGNAEPVEVFGAAGGVGELVDPDVVIAVGRQGGVEQGVVVGVVAVGQVAVID